MLIIRPRVYVGIVIKSNIETVELFIRTKEEVGLKAKLEIA